MVRFDAIIFILQFIAGTLFGLNQELKKIIEFLVFFVSFVPGLTFWDSLGDVQELRENAKALLFMSSHSPFYLYHPTLTDILDVHQLLYFLLG